MITCIILYFFKKYTVKIWHLFSFCFVTKYLLYVCHVQPDWYTQMLFIGLVTTTLIKVINTSVNAGTLQPLVWPPCSTLVVTPCNPSSTRPCSGRVCRKFGGCSRRGLTPSPRRSRVHEQQQISGLRGIIRPCKTHHVQAAEHHPRVSTGDPLRSDLRDVFFIFIFSDHKIVNSK